MNPLLSSLSQRIRKSPFLFYLARRFKYGLYFGTARRKIRGTRNKISTRHVICSGALFDIVGNDNQVEIAAGCVLINTKILIRGNHNRIVIGPDCRFMRGGTLWVEDDNGLLQIGSNNLFMDVHFAVTEGCKLVIGKDSGFADDVIVRTGDSHSIIDVASGQRINFSSDVVLGDHAAIFQRAIILKGITLRENTIVAASAVVTRSYDQPGLILAGNPAKIVRDGVTWDIQRIPPPADPALPGE